MLQSLEYRKNWKLSAVRALYRANATSLHHQVGEGETREVFTHVAAYVRPNAEQDALAFVVTGTVLVWFTKITCNDWAVDRCNNLGESDVTCRPSEDIAATDPAF